MSWVVDTCVLIDVHEADPTFGALSADRLQHRLADGLVVAPVTYVELAPAFEGSRELLDEFLLIVGADAAEPWTREDTQAAFHAWHRHVAHRRTTSTPRRPIADLLIGAFAARFQGLITRNAQDFRGPFPGLILDDPTRPVP